MSEKKKYNIPFIISAVIFISAVIGMICYFLKINSENKAFNDIKALIKEEKIESEDNQNNEKERNDSGLRYYLIGGEAVQAKFKDLYLKNKDFIGWIRIDDTPIDYPVMYTPKDEEYYIHRDFDGNYSFGGCIFIGLGADIKRPSDNMIIYGHHMADSSMFHDLDRYEDESYYQEHKYIKFDTLTRTGTYEVIAAYRTEVHSDKENYKGFEYWKFINAGKEKDFNEYVSNCKARTPYKIDVTASYGDHLISLSTCAYHTTNGRFVVVAKQIDGKEIDLSEEPIDKIESENK